MVAAGRGGPEGSGFGSAGPEHVTARLATQTKLLQHWAGAPDQALTEESFFPQFGRRMKLLIQSQTFLITDKPNPSTADILELQAEIAYNVHGLAFGIGPFDLIDGNRWFVRTTDSEALRTRPLSDLDRFLDGQPIRLPLVDLALIAHCFQIPIEVMLVESEENFLYWLERSKTKDLFNFDGPGIYDRSLQYENLGAASIPGKTFGEPSHDTFSPVIPAYHHLRFTAPLEKTFESTQVMLFLDDKDGMTLISTKDQTRNKLTYNDGAFATPRSPESDDDDPVSMWFDPGEASKLVMLVVDARLMLLDQLPFYKNAAPESVPILSVAEVFDLRCQLFSLPPSAWYVSTRVVEFREPPGLATGLRFLNLQESDAPHYNAKIQEFRSLLTEPELSSSETLLRRGIALAQDLLPSDEISPIAHLQDFNPVLADLREQLGRLFYWLGELLGDASSLREAVSCYDQALMTYTRDAVPADWARTQSGRADALSGLAEMNGDTALLREAFEGYSAALTVQSCVTTPLEWAMTRNNYANAMQNLAEMTGDAASLRQAVAAYDSALTVYTREAAPANWAATLANRATALQKLGGISGDIAFLQEAAAGYRSLLEVLTSQDCPSTLANGEPNRLALALSFAEIMMPLARDETTKEAAMLVYRQVAGALEKSLPSGSGEPGQVNLPPDRRYPSEQVAQAYNLLAFCRRRLGQIDQALEAAERRRLVLEREWLSRPSPTSHTPLLPLGVLRSQGQSSQPRRLVYIRERNLGLAA